MKNFSRIAGYENEKKELLGLRRMLLKAETYAKNGVRIPRGVLIYGEPGIGKTVLAKDIATEGISMVEIRAADLCSRNVENAIRKAFEIAKSQTPAIILLDELDKIAGTSPNFFMEDNNDVKKILLQELDALETDKAVLVVATANDVDCLGDALIRSGRFDRLLSMRAPDEATRELIIDMYLKKIKINKCVNITYFARVTRGYTGAALECLINEAGILALGKEDPYLSDEDIKLAMNRLAFRGNEQTPTSDKNELRKIAIHEAGHAIVAIHLSPDSIYGASILPQGESAGHIQFIKDEKHFVSSSSAEKEIVVILGGRVAERIALGEMSLGSINDVTQAVGRMYELIIHHGIYGYEFVVDPNMRMGECYMAEATKAKMNEVFKVQMDKLDRRAREIITDNRALFNAIVDALIEKKMLSRKELFDLKGKYEHV